MKASEPAALLEDGMKQPNIVFVHVDQMHHKAVGAYGCPHVHTPNMDRIARDGYSFMESYCAMPQCCPSRASWLTGRMSKEHGVVVNESPIDPALPDVGRWLRKLSLDELPQLWNVLRGDMSLVGPRPPMVDEVEKYSSWARKRLNTIPGITGLWQVSGRNETSFQRMVELDLHYIEHWSFLTDLKILLKTIPVVVSGRGAY